MPFFKEYAQILGISEELDYFWPVYTTIWSIALVVELVLYVFQSMSLYTIAKRRCIRHPWLSWLPICNLWILGSIADQYQYVVKGRVRNRRKVLLATGITTTVLGIAMFAMGIVIIAESLVAVTDGYISGLWFANLALSISLLSLVMAGFAVWHVVYSFIAYYDLFASCNPDTKTVFLVLGIVFEFTLPFFLFANRKKDYGMPPRMDNQYAPSEQLET